MNMIVGIIGGGNIGSSLALDCALRGNTVRVIEKGSQECEISRQNVEEMARFAPLLTPLAKQPLEEVMSRISWETDLEALKNCEFVVENITENVALKQALYEKLGVILAPNAVLAANTSCIPVTKLVPDRKPQNLRCEPGHNGNIFHKVASLLTGYEFFIIFRKEFASQP